MAPFYRDENIAEVLAELLRRRGRDPVPTRQLGLKGFRDVQHLRFATRTRRTLVTHDARDSPMLHEAWHALARQRDVAERVLHSGILVLPPNRRLATADAASGETLEYRLLVWKVGVGWQESAVDR